MKGVDTHTDSKTITNQPWSYVPDKSTCESVVASLNVRGWRESALHEGMVQYSWCHGCDILQLKI